MAEISKAQQVAAVIQGTGERSSIGVTKVISVRLPVDLLADLECFAKLSEKTRNAMVEMLLNVGIEEVCKNLTEDTLAELQGMHSLALNAELKESE